MYKTEQQGLNDTHIYINAEVNVMFTKTQSFKGFKLFDQISVAAMVKYLKQLDEGTVSGKKVVSEISPDVMSSSDKKKALDAVNIIKKKEIGP